jgi:DNA-binding beta-propeller fold protein YncE
VVFDYGDHAVKSFDATGHLRWRSGRAGSGPGEFLNPFGIAVGPDGAIWVTDVKLGRVTVLSPDGAVVSILRPEVDAALTATVPGNGTGRILTTSVQRFRIHVNLDGRVLETGDLPSPHLRGDVHPHTRQALPAGVAEGLWAAVFPVGNDLLVFDGSNLRCRGTLVEGRPAPPVPTSEVTFWVAGVVVSDTVVVTLPKGDTQDQLRMLDLYSAATCEYLATIRLPRRMMAFAWGGGTFYFEFEDPAPTIIALRLRPVPD